MIIIAYINLFINICLLYLAVFKNLYFQNKGLHCLPHHLTGLQTLCIRLRKLIKLFSE